MKTPMLEVKKGLLIKLDLFNEGGSHKTRAAKHIIQKAVAKGQIVPGRTTVIEKTGGNFGFGLIKSCKDLGIDVELAVGLGFSLTKRKYLEAMGAQLIGIQELKNGSTPGEIVENRLRGAFEAEKEYFYTDQFNNIDGLEGHLTLTGPEVVEQISEFTSNKDIIFVSCAGTGASLMGIRQCLIQNGFNVTTSYVEPLGCDSENGLFVDHRFEGMSVGVTPPFVNWSVIDSKNHVSFDEMLVTQKEFFAETGHVVGNTSAACIKVAQEESRKHPDKIVFTMAYDHGLWYEDLINVA